MKLRNNHRIVLLAASISIFFEALDIAIMNLAMPLIQESWALKLEDVQWLQTSYILFYGGFLILGGKLSDTVGKKRIFLIGAALFLLSSLSAGLSASFAQLLISRSIQGIGAALLLPSATSIVTTMYTDRGARSKAIGIFSAFAAIGSGAGLSIGGLIATELGWQWVFFINVPVITLAIGLAAFSMPADPLDPRPLPDLSSSVIITVTIGMFSYFVHALPDIVASPGKTTLLGISLVLSVVLFRFIERKNASPMIEPALLRKSAFSIVAFLLLGAIFCGYLFLISLVLQKALHYTASASGLLLLPFSIVSALAGKFLLPFLVRHLPLRKVAILGMVSMFAGSTALVVLVSGDKSILLLTLSAALVNGIGISVCYTSLTMAAVQFVEEEQHGLISSAATTAYFFGGGLGLSGLSAAMALDRSSTFQLPSFTLVVYALFGLLIVVFYKRSTSTVRR